MKPKKNIFWIWKSLWVWSCRQRMGDRNSEGDGEREKDGECEGDWDKKEEGVEPVNIVGIVKKKESSIA